MLDNIDYLFIIGFISAISVAFLYGINGGSLSQLTLRAMEMGTPRALHYSFLLVSGVLGGGMALCLTQTSFLLSFMSWAGVDDPFWFALYLVAIMLSQFLLMLVFAIMSQNITPSLPLLGGGLGVYLTHMVEPSYLAILAIIMGPLLVVVLVGGIAYVLFYSIDRYAFLCEDYRKRAQYFIPIVAVIFYLMLCLILWPKLWFLLMNLCFAGALFLLLRRYIYLRSFATTNDYQGMEFIFRPVHKAIAYIVTVFVWGIEMFFLMLPLSILWQFNISGAIGTPHHINILVSILMIVFFVMGGCFFRPKYVTRLCEAQNTLTQTRAFTIHIVVMLSAVILAYSIGPVGLPLLYIAAWLGIKLYNYELNRGKNYYMYNSLLFNYLVYIASGALVILFLYLSTFIFY